MHFTAEDLSRVRIAVCPDPLWEIVLSTTPLAGVRGRAVFGPWRAQARARLRELPGHHARLIRYLAPPVGNFPDFLTPPQAAPDLATGIETVLSTPARRLRRDLSVLPGRPGWAGPLAAAEAAALTTLGEALHGYYQAALAPVWPRVQALAGADRARRARALLDGGVHGLLHSLRPTLRWIPPLLEADYPVDRDLHLAGRGLLLLPSVFCPRTPVTYIDADLSPVLVYPITPQPGWCADPADRVRGDALARLLGPSRAAALRVIEDGCTTGELARRTGLAPATVSEHTTVLREGNLILSSRHRNTVMHTLTPLGRALLASNSPRL
ncbi:ArsR/SmtB family transcription factor [Streptomyces scabiei]|uniref:ArsR/SmtB family transcription factor n=1 Tax=Streptomyces scabiei TaxID=1930 RepID=UPI0036E2CCB1